MLKPILFVISLLALIIYLLQRMQIQMPSWVDNYVNDFLCLPIVLGFITLLFRWLKKDKTYRVSIWAILFLAGYYSFYFEYYLPLKTTRYSADYIDVILYFTGSIIFYLLNNKSRFPVKRLY
jgi:ABC-type branched-subunit amino acid transport system permease subunit